MRFFLHGEVHADTQAALVKHEHAVHAAGELSADAEANADIVGDAAVLLGMLQKRQWQLVTTDSAMVQKIYEEKLEFPGVIVLLLEGGESGGQAGGIERLFERYPRLTPRRLYTVTPNRVKIRQLPGAAQA